uniref:Ribosomal RNA large subunit methyltransferase J n=1 Tax=Gracilinema caldarium TaxID=215591 RepID=A0A7C3I7S6_9SPIR
MLGYRHAFHAGNHADIVKHFLLYHSLEYLIQKDVPILYVDTHAGSGAYSLHSGYAAQNEEWQGGYQRLMDFTGPIPQSIQKFKDFLQKCINDLGLYPGSPLIADRILREKDRRVFFELHPADYKALKETFEQAQQVSVFESDGFTGLKGLLPPPSRRACIFMDPSYELSSDYDKVLASVQEGLRRFATGTYMIWYPLLAKEAARALPASLLSLYQGNRLFVEIQTEPEKERGMFGSGLVVINPPWSLQQLIPEAIPVLAQILTEIPGDPEQAYRFQFFT